VWSGDTFVTSSRPQFLHQADRAALGDMPRRRDISETLPRRGYRFVAPGRTRGHDASPGDARRAAVREPWSDAGQEYFSDGLTDEMITQLGRLNPDELRIVGRTSSMQYKNTSRRSRRSAASFGVSYALEGVSAGRANACA